jgi:uncharacterized membrane protein YkvA (DUF1232 family)
MRLKNLPAYLTDPSIAPIKKVAIVLGVLYIISPIDAIPDLIPVLGWLDDIGILGILLTWLMKELDRRPVEVTDVEVLQSVQREVPRTARR